MFMIAQFCQAPLVFNPMLYDTGDFSVLFGVEGRE